MVGNPRVFVCFQVVCHPMDTVKTRMQIKDPTKKLRKWKRKISKKAIEIGPIGIDNWFFKGPADLFRGVWGAILGTIPNAMLYFVAYECKTETCNAFALTMLVQRRC